MSRSNPYSLQQLSWRSIKHWPRSLRPAGVLQPWLTDPGSLTARLLAKSAGKFEVEVYRQVIGRPRLDEWKLLGLRRPGLALIREVVLRGHGKDWVFARSVLPLSSLTRELRHLRKQHNRPLGAFLFSQPHLVRSPLEIAPITLDKNYVPKGLIAPTAADEQHQQTLGKVLWGRRSVFYLRAKPLLVSEVFLPDFVASLT